MKKISLLVIALLAAIVLAACNDSSAASDKDTVKVKIGVNGSDGAQWPVLKEKAAKEGIEIELIEFADYTLPNNALAQGDIDLNAFQHIKTSVKLKKAIKLPFQTIHLTRLVHFVC